MDGPALAGQAAMLPRALALALVLAAALVPSLLRNHPESPRSCRPEGRGTPPRHWIACAGDPGPPRDLLPDERLALGLPIDLNAAGERELAFVPGLSRRLARAVVVHRAASGPFASVDGLLAVKGIGPRRLEQARPWLVVPGAY
jgi:competence protein ComEA